MPRNKKPDLVIKTGKSDISIYSHYEEDPEKSRQAWEEIQHGLRYIAKQGGWLDVLIKRETILARLMLLQEIEKNLVRH